ncbi:hypothetical protein OB955_08765 [Halobacteria archaeon AArc-m2/3/4]|uniref:Uncharacterized protein n=1 Tax=Natronoglomus mannanivorans TaxID=2979990 RepID=A0AAP3E3I3_9EURY|nr:hypothetical protein [Halobacteria archaeon AArc-xg1-1]MCU4972831.1 hypothetical protein [Halobacteria archaeon AArc-m2/3/4]
MKYCLHCDWSVGESDGLTATERSREALEHHVETGHAVDSSESMVRPDVPSLAASTLVADLLGSPE